MNCFVVLVNYLITVMRKQKFMLFIYIFVSIVMQLLAVPVTKQFNVEGAATLYLVSISFIAFLLLLVFIGSYKKKGRSDRNESNYYRRRQYRHVNGRGICGQRASCKLYIRRSRNAGVKKSKYIMPKKNY